MAHMFLRHKVQDFRKWKPAYEAHQQDRAATGLKNLKLWHNIGDSNEIVVLLEISDNDTVRWCRPSGPEYRNYV